MSDRQVVRVEDDEGIFTIYLDRPEKRNAMSLAMHRQMHEILTELRFNRRVRVLVITGSGESFCAGQDLKEYFVDLSAEEGQAERERSRAMANEWRSYLLRLFPVPTIAAVNGWCFGGAFSIVAACDIAVAADDATFGLSEINMKNFPGGLVSKHVSEMMQPRAAAYYALTGEPFSGARAAEMGFVTRAVPRAELPHEVRRIATMLRDKDPQALRAAKEVLKMSWRMGYEEAYAFSAAKQGDLSLQQRGNWMDSGIGDFLDGKYRPGLDHARSTGGATAE